MALDALFPIDKIFLLKSPCALDVLIFNLVDVYESKKGYSVNVTKKIHAFLKHFQDNETLKFRTPSCQPSGLLIVFRRAISSTVARKTTGCTDTCGRQQAILT